MRIHTQFKAFNKYQWNQHVDITPQNLHDVLDGDFKRVKDKVLRESISLFIKQLISQLWWGVDCDEIAVYEFLHKTLELANVRKRGCGVNKIFAQENNLNEVHNILTKLADLLYQQEEAEEKKDFLKSVRFHKVSRAHSFSPALPRNTYTIKMRDIPELSYFLRIEPDFLDLPFINSDAPLISQDSFSFEQISSAKKDFRFGNKNIAFLFLVKFALNNTMNTSKKVTYLNKFSTNYFDKMNWSEAAFHVVLSLKNIDIVGTLINLFKTDKIVSPSELEMMYKKDFSTTLWPKLLNNKEYRYIFKDPRFAQFLVDIEADLNLMSDDNYRVLTPVLD